MLIELIILIIILLITVIVLVFSASIPEYFDQKTVEFVPVNAQRYGLRSDKIHSTDIAKYYRSPYRNIILDPTSGQMWESDRPPNAEGINGCNKISCPPLYNDYDSLDTCWQCGSAQPDKMIIPDIHPHVKN